MSTDRRVVVASLLWVGILVAASRRWIGDVRAYIERATQGASTKPTPSSSQQSGAGGKAGGGAGGGGGGSW